MSARARKATFSTVPRPEDIYWASARSEHGALFTEWAKTLSADGLSVKRGEHAPEFDRALAPLVFSTASESSSESRGTWDAYDGASSVQRTGESRGRWPIRKQVTSRLDLRPGDARELGWIDGASMPGLLGFIMLASADRVETVAKSVPIRRLSTRAKGATVFTDANGRAHKLMATTRAPRKSTTTVRATVARKAKRHEMAALVPWAERSLRSLAATWRDNEALRPEIAVAHEQAPDADWQAVASWIRHRPTVDPVRHGAPMDDDRETGPAVFDRRPEVRLELVR